MEALLCILRELFEEQSQQSVDVLASCQGGVDRGTMRIASVDRLVKENDIGLVVQRIGVSDRLEVLANLGRTQLKEQASHG